MISETATTLIKSNIEIAISNATPACRPRVRRWFRRCRGCVVSCISSRSLIRIQPMPSPVKLHQPRQPRLRVYRGRLHNQGNLDVEYVRRRVERSRQRATLRRAVRQLTGVRKNRNRSARGKHRWISGSNRGDLRTRSVVHHVYDIRTHGRRRRRNGISVRFRHPAAQQRRRPCRQLIPNPFDPIVVLRIDVRLHDEIEIAWACACPKDTCGIRAPCKRRRCIGRNVRQNRKLIPWRISCVVNIAHNLIQPQPRFLETRQYPRIRLITLLRRTKQAKRRSRDNYKHRRRNHELQQREPPFSITGTTTHSFRPLHFCTVASSVNGTKNPCPPIWRAPIRNRRPVMCAPFT